jgi:hypothetical protein
MSITSVISGISSAVDGAKTAYNALNTITKKSAEI